jgi:hypothetical protein
MFGPLNTMPSAIIEKHLMCGCEVWVGEGLGLLAARAAYAAGGNVTLHLYAASRRG